ncbi:MAG: hypothetical protein ACP5GS_08215 [Nitrososphaeria archaeon]
MYLIAKAVEVYSFPQKYDRLYIIILQFVTVLSAYRFRLTRTTSRRNYQQPAQNVQGAL